MLEAALTGQILERDDARPFAVFGSRQAIVIGPTPFGTGVIADVVHFIERDVADQPRLTVNASRD